MVNTNKGHSSFRTKRKKTTRIVSGFVKQRARPVSAGVVDLVPIVQGSRCWGKHDQKLFLQAQAVHPRRWVVSPCPGQYLPGGGVCVLLVSF